ncbi:MAG: hypothetical protein QGH13_01815 [Candidatus Thalassarchaeaceae archaeon]|nr:hypothetical protein [Candidatus Thalassarchaeaceae archaeon]
MDGAIIEVCSGDTAFTIVPENEPTISIEIIVERIEKSGFSCSLRSKFCHTFQGKFEMTLYPSGRLLVRAPDIETANQIAELHIGEWLAS